jgi:hypothetical protein
MLGKLYEALLEAGASPHEAREASEGGRGGKGFAAGQDLARREVLIYIVLAASIAASESGSEAGRARLTDGSNEQKGLCYGCSPVHQHRGSP